MHKLSVTLFGLSLALLLILIKQQHAVDNLARYEVTNSAKNGAANTMKSNAHGTAMDFVEGLKTWDSLLFTNNRNINTETKFRKNRKRMKLLRMFRNVSTKLRIQKKIQFQPKNNLKLAKAEDKEIEKISAKSHVQKPRRRRQPDIPSSELGGQGPPNVDDGKSRNCTTDENFTFSCNRNLSCSNRCQHPRNVSFQAQLSCFCDEECEFFQDCCADFDDFCGTNGQNMTNNTTKINFTAENLVNQQNRHLWSCYKGLELKGTSGIWMIGSCPSTWPKDDVLYRCRNLSSANTITEDNYRYLPVYTSNGRVYHNQFCAQCNGVSPKDMNNFNLSIECQFSPPQHLSLEGKIQFLFQYCSEKIKWKESGNPRRYCLAFETIDENATEHETKCTQSKPRVVSTSQKIFKNVACARCKDSLSCGPNIKSSNKESGTEGSTPVIPLSLIFDFNPGSTSLKTSKTQCPKNKVYDHYLEICREGFTSGLPINASYLNEYRVVLWVLPPKGLSSCFQEATASYFLAKTLGISQKQVKDLHVESFEDPTRNKLQFTLEITQKERSMASIKRILDFTSPFNVSIVGQVFTVVKATHRILSCANRRKYDRSEYTVLQDGSSAVSIKKTGEIFQFTDYYLNTTKEPTSANDSQAVFVCRQHQISNCSGVYILMNEGEFRVLMNKSIFVNTSKRVYDWSEYTWINKSVLVCENFSNTYYKSKDDPVLITLTIVCMSLSIIGLVFVLVTYSLFSELRTTPGISLMNLSVSILLAQLLWLLGAAETDTPTACTVIAVILHYLFLVSFAWTSIIAFDTWRAFSAKGRRPLPESKKQKMMRCLRLMAVGWLPVLVYVSICVALDFTDTVDIGYKSRIACWMANKWAILYFFAVPVFMFLVFNIAFCVLTFRAIKATTAQARAASDQDTKKNFGIYVRIASLMGFTWIFGFAAPFGWQFLWYPFVILNGLQGVYIALAFPLSNRARSLYKDWLAGKPSQETIANSSISRARVQESKYCKDCKGNTKL